MRSDQITFLRGLDNASTFVREALDQFMAKSDRALAEKTISLYEGAKELEAKIASQAMIIKETRAQTEEIEKKIKKAQSFLKVAQNVANGEFEIEPYQGKFRVLAELV